MADRAAEMYDYPPEHKEKATPEEVAHLGQLADRLFTEMDERVLRDLMEREIPDLLLSTGLPRADFKAPCGRMVRVKTTFKGSRVHPGKEAEAKRWLGGKTLKAAFMACLRRGEVIPSDIFAVAIRTIARPDKKG